MLDGGLDVTAMSPAAPRLFVRNASGLVRTVGIAGAIYFGVHCISLSSSGILTFYSVPGLWPGADLLIVLTLSAILCAMHAYTYSQIGAAAPRSGADYTLASRTLSPWLAFPASFALVVFSGLVAGALIVWIPTFALPALLRATGVLYEQSVFGTVGVLITLISLFYPTRTVVRVLGIGFVLGIAAWVVIVFSLATGSAETFQANWNTYVPGGPYDQVVSTAEANGMVFDRSFGNSVVAGLLMGFWIFYGYYIPTFFAGEVKEASRTLKWGAWGSLIITWAIFAGAVLLFTRFVPLDWMTAQGWLFINGANLDAPFQAEPIVTFYASVLQPNVIFFLIMAVVLRAPGMLVPASIIAGIGAILYYQNSTGDWDSWAYAWALIPGFAGVGVILMGLFEGRFLHGLKEGLGAILFSLFMFGIFGAFLGGPAVPALAHPAHRRRTVDPADRHAQAAQAGRRGTGQRYSRRITKPPRSPLFPEFCISCSCSPNTLHQVDNLYRAMCRSG